MPKKLRVGVMMGGRSGEHEVSVVSASSVIKALNKDKYDVVSIGITKTGQWISGPGTVESLKAGMSNQQLAEKILLPDPNHQSLVSLKPDGLAAETALDVVIPLIHGTYGEDGKLQGLLEMANLPYVGCGVLGSAVGMDKVIMKNLFRQAGLLTPDFVLVLKKDWLAGELEVLKTVAAELTYPVFVKPANFSSSVGISKVKDPAGLARALAEAFKYDRRAIVEKSIENNREIECAVLGNDEPEASVPGEIIPHHEFYSYEAKYVDENGAGLAVPAKLDEPVVRKIQELSLTAFKALDLSGMARVDFLLDPAGRIYLNEVNTVPGFTKISMYPKLWQASGLPYDKLIDRLIELALARHQEKNALKTSFDDIDAGWQANY